MTILLTIPNSLTIMKVTKFLIYEGDYVIS